MTSATAPGSMATGASISLPQGARRSHALDAMVQLLRQGDRLQILDLGGINQPNLDFLTGLGHRLYAEDLLKAYELSMAADSGGAADQVDILLLTRFIEDAFPFKPGSVHAAVLWDTLQFLPEPAADAILDRLHFMLAPHGVLLAFFHPENGLAKAAPQACRILDGKHLAMQPRPGRYKARAFNPRTIERFFQRFSSVKFYLTRENMQEVLVRR
jgi:hypothetical protein